ncbi:hypothetical protein [Oerskovia flava]|uniref:hypothetical protein n=1 Tax=Oerskovia flava TaxID=2986422 RepID=UPI00223F387A|nr:hypothetical protein [Oerskovia sp. JB1-3-2]
MRGAAVAVGAALLVGSTFLVGPGAAAQEGLFEGSHSRFEYSASGGEVDATVTLTLRNDTPGDGAYFYYWDEYAIPVPSSAEDVRAVSGGADLRVTLEPSDDPNTTFATAAFSPLNYGRTRTVEWTYTIPGEPIRSPGYTRVGRGYATFPAQGVGDPGEVEVEVVLPESMSFDATADIFERRGTGKTVTYTATDSTDEFGIWAIVSARDPQEADEREIEVGDVTLTLRSFPGDDEWIDFVDEQVTAGLPVVEEMLGHSWPGGLETIREDVSPQVLGYAWFDPDEQEIVIPEDLDEALLFHELTHAWLNPEHIEGRWLYEGLTEVVAHRVVERTGGTSEPRDAPQRSAKHALPLVDWQEPESELTHEIDDYAYPAAFTAVSELLGDLDDETFTEVVAAAYAGEGAFEVPGSVEVNSTRTQWRRFLDLVEVRAGVTGGDEVMRTWVVDADEHDRLDERTDALTAYTTLDEADGDWQPPVGLRSAMTQWRYPRADEIVTTISSSAEQAGAVQDAAAEVGLPEPAAVRALYENAREDDEYTALATVLPQAVEVVEQVGEASSTVAADGDPFTELGERLLDVDQTAADARTALDEGELDDAAALAETTTSRSGLALWLGLGVVVLPLALLGGLVVGVVRFRRRRRNAPPTDDDVPAPPVVEVAPQA